MTAPANADLPAAATRVAERFGHPPSEPIVPFGRGHINETFLVTAQSGEFVLQRINAGIFADVESLAANIAVVSNHLTLRFMRDLVPEVITDPAGNALVYEAGAAWRLSVRVAGAAPPAESTPARADAAGHLLGRFHAGLADLDPAAVHETLPGFHDPQTRFARLLEVVDRDPFGRVSGVRAELEVVMAHAPLADRAADLVRRVRVRVAHNDAKLDNVLFTDGAAGAVCLVDLDTLMPTAWFWDVGDLLRSASTTVDEDDVRADLAVVDPALYAAVLEGYRRGLAITSADPVENEALDVAGAIVTFEQAVRFLTDWIEGDVYYRTAHPQQNLDRARNQLALLASMPGTVGA